ncbi:MAG: hypothetical protein ACREFX_11910 [Opitutaceae bacterium]
MTPRASNAPQTRPGVTPIGKRARVEEEITWGRPVFRPPLLGNPQVIHDPLPFRTQNFTAQRIGGAH